MIATNYNPKESEEKWYKYWMEQRFFHSEPDQRTPYCIVIPPPNVTGVLHMGHMLNNTIQDALVRRARLQGKNACWVPGTDHASIATEAKVVAKLKSEGIGKHDLSREEFLKHAWEWTEKHGGIILQQLKRLGASCDWDRTCFTMDEIRSESVLKVFIDLYNKGYIYKGVRMVNWDPAAQTAVSDEEVIYKEEKSKLYYLRYKIVGEDHYITIATTRPETILGDSAVCVNPNDERFRHLAGKKCIVPLVNREIPIIQDEYVDMEFGTGALKITPAHDVNDYEIGYKHHLETIDIFNDDGTMSEAAQFFVGEDRFKVREEIIPALEKAGNLVKIEDYDNKVGYSERTNVVIEPKLSMQWFLKMKELSKPALDAVMNDDVILTPSKYKNTYRYWMENVKDWCISRQLWWGHRIPAYYCDDCGEMTVAKSAPAVCPKCGGTHLHQDEDTLDTWFSSALWPFSTLGWPKDTPEYEYFYPTDVLVTGYDIIFFWVIRMVFSGLEQTGKEPFHTVLIHGLVRDSQGRKMSKSLGNGIDPLEVIDKYGADALRMTLMTGNAPGNDMRFYWERVEASRNFANKVWNASRFIMMNIEKAPVTDVKLSDLQMADRWILSKVNTLAKDVTENMDKYELGIALQKVYDFIWEEFCDWYIEMVKPRLWSEEDTTKAAALWTLKTVLIQSLKLLHPYMPFITEEIFCNLQDEEPSIMISSWPEYKDEWNFADEEKAVETIKDAVRAIRGVRTSMNVPPSKKAKVYVVSEDPEVLAIFEHSRVFFATLGYASEVVLQKDKSGIADDAVSAVTAKATIYMPFAELVDLDKEIERLTKEEEKLKKELARSEGMLSNEKFVSRAPEAKIAEEREKLEKYRQMMAQVQERLAQLRK